ncbi:diguanylate cyclase (GGDEF) domain-containing protein [Geosporobacter subterraneus DSM 17957]|uniref:Diguanylate cyclase (GGDEF) domain-containing protein n=1 Tax=Geosporobacter subterraneus DSM 17957 TaxID=1121919 RepID=A0A1M6M9V2_9FIRM|nr:GGDEF domain-containing protein [Geosporobacter subterraneus]SHJ80245.1 diguanylate cyclase (GGDEF) domain-containing protein [Geosporobacter subterraneus DSM 17957]
MKDKVFEISLENFINVHPEDGVLKIKNIGKNNGNLSCFLVMENSKLLGVITLKDLLFAHPNRIAADVMSNRYEIISPNDFLWSAKNRFSIAKCEVLIVMKDSDIVGVLTEPQIDIALGKHVDPLTGLFKSSYIYYYAEELIRKNKEVSFIFIDLNNFGIIDKKYGHIIGDKLLQEISALLLQIIPKDTYLCRYAGDEFLILTPYLLDDAVLLTEKIIHTVFNHTFTNQIDITIAAGISGGRRLNSRNHTTSEMVKNLVNLASLASSRAKYEKCDYVVADKVSVYNTEECII